MDRFDQEMSDLSSSEVVSWKDAAAFGRRNYAEGLAAGMKEGEAKLKAEVDDLKATIDLNHRDYQEMYNNRKNDLEEAEAKLYDTEVKRGQDIMEFEREKKALTAELAAAQKRVAELEDSQENVAALWSERDKANARAAQADDECRQMQERLTRAVEGHKALTAENKRMREALMKIMTWWPTVSFARMTLLIDPVQVCREALAPTEKPAPDVAIIGPDGTGCATGASAVPAPDGEGRKQAKEGA